MMTNNARHALVWQLTVNSAARTGSRTHHRNPGLDIRAIFEEGRENAKLVDCRCSPSVALSTTLGKGTKPTPGEIVAGRRWYWVMNELDRWSWSYLGHETVEVVAPFLNKTVS